MKHKMKAYRCIQFELGSGPHDGPNDISIIQTILNKLWLKRLAYRDNNIFPTSLEVMTRIKTNRKQSTQQNGIEKEMAKYH